jgi:calcium-dependent protein kinase
VKIINRERS